MSRLSDALMQPGSSFAKGRATPMVNINNGSPYGFSPDLAAWASMTHYVNKNLVCMLLEAPKGFQYLPDPQFWVSALKSLVEVQARTWDGFNAGLEVDMAETAVGGSNEMFQDIVNVTRTRTNPSMGVTDLYGRPIQNFLQDWITYLIGDPDSKVPMISTIAGVRPQDMLADMYAATMLFFEPDPTHTKVAKAWLCTNMYPKSTGEITGKRDLTSAGQTSELTIEWSSIAQTGLGVVSFAQSLLDRVNLTNANPNLRAAFMQNIAPDVLASPAQGYKGSAEQLGASTVIRS